MAYELTVLIRFEEEPDEQMWEWALDDFFAEDGVVISVNQEEV